VLILLDKLQLEPGCEKSGWVDQKALRAFALYQGTTLVVPHKKQKPTTLHCQPPLHTLAFFFDN